MNEAEIRAALTRRGIDVDARDTAEIARDFAVLERFAREMVEDAPPR